MAEFNSSVKGQIAIRPRVSRAASFDHHKGTVTFFVALKEALRDARRLSMVH